jgi:hypothetical protein
MSWDWLKLERLLSGRALPARHVAISVNGTGSPDPFGPGFAGELCSQLNDEEWFWQPCGYPADTVNMGASVDVGVDNVVALVLLYPAGAPLPTGGVASGKVALAGYSQGAMVTDKVWRDECINPAGRLHHRYLAGDIIAIVNCGDPMRAPGISNGNVRAGFPIPKPLDGAVTGGIAGPDDLTPEQTPAFLMSCNNDGDLYGAAPVGATPWIKQTGVGHDETLIFNLIQKFGIANLFAIAQEVVATLTEVVANPAGLIGSSLAALIGQGVAVESHVVALVQALANGGLFVVEGFGPHGDYEKFIPAMVDFVHEAGRDAYALAA